MAYDKKTKQTILFGDRGTGRTSQTWAWTPQSGWKQLAPTTNPPGRTWGNIAYDDATGLIVLFGGQSATPAANGGLNPLGDTWTWDGTDWAQQSPAKSPPATVNMSLAYDASTQTVIGVRDDDTTAKVETWQWDGATWKMLQPSQSPAYPKPGAGMAYAALASAVVMYGTAFPILSPPPPDAKTWTFGAGTWTGHAPAGSNPPPRFFPGMSEAQDAGVLMFGGGGSGYTVYADTWAWLGKWVKKSVSLAPKARTMARMAYDSTCGLVVLYGGELQTGSSLTPYYDTWVWNGQGWVKVG